jgi:tetratricopeptide (TPR) repeat protein
MPVNFYELIGPGGKDEARNVFEKLIVQIVRIGHPAMGIAPTPGDWGIDAIVGELDRGVSIWQAKYFIDGFGPAQHDQVRRSFQSALNASLAHGYRLDEWTLCVPVEPAAETARWWAQWRRKTTQSTGVTITLMAGSAIESVLMSRDAENIARHYFPKSLGPVVDARHGRRRVRFGLPLRLAHFAGRSRELGDIDEALSVGGRAVVTQAVSGLGGVGKSQIAGRYAQQHSDDYDIVAWIRAEHGGIADLSDLAGALELPTENLTPAERAASVVRWLGGCDERWLLVLDNVCAPEHLLDCCPSSGNGRVIVTSRDRAMAQFGPELVVDVFDESTAVSYLLDRAGRTDERAGAKRLAGALGHLPLALTHAGAYCAAGTRFEDYLAMLDTLPAAELFASHPEASYAQTVASTWRASIERATDEADLAAAVLDMAAHMGPDAIPKALFGALAGNGTVADEKRVIDALNALARLSLVSVNDDALSVHRLLQKTVRDATAARGDRTPALRALSAVDAAFTGDVWQPANWPRCEQLLPHATALLNVSWPADDAGAQLIGLLNRACEYLIAADAGHRSLAHAQTVSRHAQRVVDGDDVRSFSTRDNLASAYYDVGRTADAIATYEALLDDRERVLGPSHPDVLATRNDLALTYVQAGRCDDAIAIYSDLLPERTRVLGADHPETLSTRNNLGMAYHDAGRTAEAIATYELLLADRVRIIGPKHPKTLTTRNNLANSYRQAGRLEEAVAMLETLLADREDILGSRHPGTLMTRNNLANAYRQSGRSAEAIVIFESVMHDREELLGLDHPHTLMTRNYLALAYQAQGRVDEARALLELVLADRERTLGGEHPDTVVTRGDLADLDIAVAAPAPVSRGSSATG